MLVVHKVLTKKANLSGGRVLYYGKDFIKNSKYKCSYNIDEVIPYNLDNKDELSHFILSKAKFLKSGINHSVETVEVKLKLIEDKPVTNTELYTLTYLNAIE